MKQTLELCPDVGYQLQFGGLFHMDPQVNCTAQIALGNVQILYFPFTHGDSGPSLRTYQHPSLVTPRMSQADLTITLSCFGAQWRNGTSGSGYVYFDDASFKPSSHALGSEAANPEGQKPVKARYGPFGRQQ